jgi:membrane protease YdiL (CAAX protease family)
VSGGERSPGADGGAGLAATAYVTVLLLGWLVAGQLFEGLFPERPRLALVGAQLLGLLLPALALTRALSAVGLAPTTSRRPPPPALALALALPGMAVGGFLVALGLNVAWLRALQATGWAWVPELEDFVEERYEALLAADGTAELVIVLLVASLLPALCEETAFRRGLQGLLASRWGVSSAVLSASIVFAAFHLEPFGLPTRIFLGLSLGVAYHRCGSLWPPALLHAAHNAAAIGAFHLSRGLRGEEARVLGELETVSLAPVSALGAVGLLVWLASVALLRPRRSATTMAEG